MEVEADTQGEAAPPDDKKEQQGAADNEPGNGAAAAPQPDAAEDQKATEGTAVEDKDKGEGDKQDATTDEPAQEDKPAKDEDADKPQGQEQAEPPAEPAAEEHKEEAPPREAAETDEPQAADEKRQGGGEREGEREREVEGEGEGEGAGQVPDEKVEEAAAEGGEGPQPEGEGESEGGPPLVTETANHLRNDIERTAQTTTSAVLTLQQAIGRLGVSADLVDDPAKKEEIKQAQQSLQEAADELERLRDSLQQPDSAKAAVSASEEEDKGPTPMPPVKDLLDNLDRKQVPSVVGSSCKDATGEEPQDASELSFDERAMQEDMDSLRRVRRQLECDAEGRDLMEGVEAPVYEADYVDDDLSELKRVRRQIRYLFGGLLQSLPAQNAETLAEQLNLPKFPPDPSDLSKSATPVVSGKEDDRPLVPHRDDYRPARPQGRHRESRSTLDGGVVRGRGYGEEREGMLDEETQPEDDSTSGGRRRPSHKGVRRGEEARPPGGDWASEVIKLSLDPDNQWEWGRNRSMQPYGRGDPSQLLKELDLSYGVKDRQRASWETPHTSKAGGPPADLPPPRAKRPSAYSGESRGESEEVPPPISYAKQHSGYAREQPAAAKSKQRTQQQQRGQLQPEGGYAAVQPARERRGRGGY
ncbi:unnamed protein product [Vitrella brassicaformis CCMP3155]|uniref:Uncharacterized protein n=2 Tax=Vitrella brassicaformis TaxID=1169539 RepID=A0A0G4EEY6_VITBC|nr:unnamed protein product [Vitrella brassicaformis CCMP3155]|eukprot:CEL94263.1 unnamed protein product [Vitrella brassicaformis CCMP3155]